MGKVRLSQLTKAYAGTNVVENFNLIVDHGELCVLLGPSGSGKTTIMNMIAGFVPPSAGEIFVDDVATAGLPPHERQIGMVFQNYALFPHLTVFENVAFPLRARGMKGDGLLRRVTRMLDLVELGDFAERLPAQLSGGQQQRTALARALSFDPRVLLMDEPLAALDRRLRDRMQSELRALQRELQITVIYVTHDQQEAMTLADKVVVMNKGRAEQIGPPLEVYHRPRTRFVSEFLGESNILSASVIGNDGSTVEARLGVEGRISFLGGRNYAIGETVLVAIRPESIRISSDNHLHDNGLLGRVHEVVDTGALRRFRVAIDDTDQSILLFEQGGPRPSTTRHGDRVVVTWERADAVVIEA